MLEDDEMVRGYQPDKNKKRFVVVTDEELDKLEPRKSRDIDLRRFVPRDSIPEIYFERGYFMTPSGDTQKAYRLLAETMEASDRAGIGTFVMRGKEYPIAIVSDNGILRAETLRFADELRSASDIKLPKKKEAPKASVTKFEKLIKSKTKKQLPTRIMKEEESERLLKLVKRKSAKGKDVVESTVSETDTGNVIDIMEVLKRSLSRKAG